MGRLAVTGTWLRRVALTLVVLIGLVAVLTARVITRGSASLELSDAAFDRGDLETATLEARTAALAYVPGAPHVAAAYERMAAIARGSEAEGRYAVARTAWSSVERAALETAHWFDPRTTELEEARLGLARLDRVERARTGEGVDTSAPPHAALAERKALGRTSAERGVQLTILVLAFVLLLAGFAGAGLWGITVEGRTNRRALVVGLGLVLGGAACWVLALVWG